LEAVPLSQKPDRNLAMELVRVTESAALAASKWVGRGDKNAADGAAVDAMRNLLDTVNMDGVVVIGEGEKDEAPMLFNGEHVGNGSKPVTDVAVDPIDGTTLTSLGRGNALSVIAVAERGSMFNPGPFVYMNKIAVGPDARGAVDITKSVTANLHAIARAKRKTLNEVTVVVLDRPRHDDLVGEIRAAGCRIKMITDGDIFGAIASAWPETGVDALMGIGGTPEGVTAAAAIKALGGEIQGLLWARGEEDRALAKAAGIDMNRVLTTDDLVQCDDAFFAATGVTDGDLLRGVRYDAYGATSQSLVMRVRSGTIRTIDTRHRADRIGQYSSVEFR
jgi:fructose-1,6-bisphosphatase II